MKPVYYVSISGRRDEKKEPIITTIIIAAVNKSSAPVTDIYLKFISVKDKRTILK